MKLKFLGLASILLSASFVTMASQSTAGAKWSFLSSDNDTNNHISGSGAHTSLHGSKDGVSLDITGWSSALHGGQSYCGTAANDRCVLRSKLTRYNKGGLGVINIDETDDEPNHSIDNNANDFDMILLTFSEAVNISAIHTGWNFSYTAGAETSGTGDDERRWNHANASALAYTGNGTPPAFSTYPDSSTQYRTWSDIAGDGWNSIADNARTVNKSGQIGNIPITNNLFSRFWLLGAAHVLDQHNMGSSTDHIKISGVTFHKQQSGTPDSSTPVNAPASIALLIAAGIVALRRKKQS
ncbi:exosortase-dependent surface protein XDP1 [Glaciecola siphonariae]|uniref:Exosortase-dependent surface protein XDP1 n=1 Tax=Glaciecola siphonariae TaxID=521012 RepID=A0ABV9M073_9ALTE